jgi:hypothetical protein
MGQSMTIYTTRRFQELSLLKTPCVVERINAFLSSKPETDIFGAAFAEMRVITDIARAEGVLALSRHKSEYTVINELLSLIVESVDEFGKAVERGDAEGPFIDFEYIEYPVFLVLPQILYGAVPPADFVKTVLLFESIIMTVSGYPTHLIEYRLNPVAGRPVLSS